MYGTRLRNLETKLSEAERLAASERPAGYHRTGLAQKLSVTHPHGADPAAISALPIARTTAILAGVDSAARAANVPM